MAKNPESRYTDKVHRQLKKLYPNVLITRMCMMPGTSNGVADVLYEGSKSHLWVEYKYLDKWENKRKLPISKLSANQINFIHDRVKQHIPIVVIFGSESGQSYVYNIKQNIQNPPEMSIILNNLLTPKETAEYINKIVT